MTLSEAILWRAHGVDKPVEAVDILERALRFVHEQALLRASDNQGASHLTIGGAPVTVPTCVDACACGTDVRTRPASAVDDYRAHLASSSHSAWRDRR